MTIGDWIAQASLELENSSNSAHLDSLLLAEHILKIDRTYLLANDKGQIAKPNISLLSRALTRRKKGEPVAYIVGFIEFYGRRFYVDRHVLTPRPESEAFIEIVYSIFKANPQFRNVIDIGTGSGALAITIKLSIPEIIVTASDISISALKITAKNALTYHASILIEKQNLLQDDKNVYEIVTANLPYLPTVLTNPTIQFEPKRALYSGQDGLNHYRRLFKQLKLRPVPFVIVEVMENQFSKLDEIAMQSGYSLSLANGLVRAYSH